MSPTGPETPIRITPAFFFLLLTLVDGERHGYAMAKEAPETRLDVVLNWFEELKRLVPTDP